MTGDHPKLLPSVTVPTGPKTVQVGSSTYYVPQSAGVAMSGGGGIAYVLFRSRVHMLVSSGEVDIPNRLRGIIASQHFGGHRPRQPSAAVSQHA